MPENATTTASMDQELLDRAAKAGSEGCPMNYGEASAVKRLAERGLVEWWQASPFIAYFRLRLVSAAGETNA